MSTKHTPGPWSAELNGEDGKMEVHDESGCTCTVHGLKSDPEHVANLHLIAAAPDLLKALRLLVDHASQYAAMPLAHSDTHKHVALARAAIAKAEGQS